MEIMILLLICIVGLAISGVLKAASREACAVSKHLLIESERMQMQFDGMLQEAREANQNFWGAMKQAQELQQNFNASVETFQQSAKEVRAVLDPPKPALYIPPDDGSWEAFMRRISG